MTFDWAHELRKYDSDEYKTWRKAVKTRDKYKCQFPGCEYDVQIHLQVHHIERIIDRPDLIFDVSNGITLCRKCHTKVTGMEYMYESLFKDIVHSAET